MTLLNKLKSLRDKNPLLGRILRNTAYLLSSNTLVMGLSLLQSAVSARMLDVAGFGMLGTITIFATVINKLTSFRMGEIVIKYVGHHHENGDYPRAAAVFKAAALSELAASLLAFLLIWLLAPLGAVYLAKEVGTESWFIIYGLVVVVNFIAESSTGLLQFFDRFRHMGALNIAQSLVTLALILVAWQLQTGLLGVLLAYLTGKAISALGLTVAALLEATRRWGRGWWNTSLRLLKPQIRELVRFAVSTNISASLSLINKDSELLWVSFFTSPLQAGYYKVTLALANFLSAPVTPLPQATYPELSRAVARKNWKEMRYILRQGSRIAGGYTALAGLLLILLGRVIIQYIYTPDFLPAYDGLIVLVVGYIVANALYWARTALLSLGLPHYATLVNVLVTVLKVIGVVILIPRIGYLGSAIMLAVSYVLGTSLSANKVYKEIRHQEAAVPPAQHRVAKG